MGGCLKKLFTLLDRNTKDTNQPSVQLKQISNLSKNPSADQSQLEIDIMREKIGNSEGNSHSYTRTMSPKYANTISDEQVGLKEQIKLDQLENNQDETEARFDGSTAQTPSESRTAHE